MTMKNWLAVLFLAGFATGCASTVTNLTPSQLPRSANNLYPLEVALDTPQQTIRDETIQASVIVGNETYPMRPTPMLRNRWETLVPIPANQNHINYRYKFDYEYSSIPQRRQGSKLSPPYRLDLIDPAN